MSKSVRLYVLLAGLFTALLVLCNLIANKFFYINLPFREDPLVLSCGILPYPLTFVITDLLSEFYGKKNSSWVVWIGFLASTLVLLFIKLALDLPAVDFSPVSSEQFAVQFGNSWRIIGASMIAYLLAQTVDVQLYHFWKKWSGGKYLWLRNNGSTIVSQLMDTSLVVFIIFFGTGDQGNIGSYILDGFLFKLFIALLDTGLIYALVPLIRNYLSLKRGEEVHFKIN